MINSLSNSIFIVCIILLAVNCRKKDIVPAECTDNDTLISIQCEPFPPVGSFGYIFVENGEQYTAPAFNPNNENEFAYISQIQGEARKLMKYNIGNSTSSIISASTNIIGKPTWGPNNWIAFSATGWKIWRIDTDGNNLQQITFGVSDIYPDFYGQNICYYRNRLYTNAALSQNPDLYYEYIMMVIDINGNKLDSFEVASLTTDPYYQAWFASDFTEERVYFCNISSDYEEAANGIFFLDLNTEQIEKIETDYFVGGYPNVLDLEYGNGNVYCSVNFGDLIEIDVDNASVNVLVEGCQTNFYRTLSISNDETKMIGEKVLSTELESGAIDQKHEIWMIDLLTGEETRLIGQ